MVRTASLLPVLAILACTSSASRKAEDAEASVRRFFAALPSGDCEVLGPLLATGSGARPCAEAVREMNEHGLQLVEILESKVDGRDPDAVLVRTRVSRNGVLRAEPYILRVERQGETWRLRF